jgi:Zn-dependent protease with chaperone function
VVVKSVIQGAAAPSFADFVDKESKVQDLSLVVIDDPDRAFTKDKLVMISKNIWEALSNEGKYYLLCHEAGHYLEGHNRSANVLVGIFVGSLGMWPLVDGIAASAVALFGAGALGMLAAHNQQWVMYKEYQADDRGYRLLEQIYPGAYLRGMLETNRFYKMRDAELLNGAKLKKKQAMREKHLALKQDKLRATHKIA